jgi:hypothetical protein
MMNINSLLRRDQEEKSARAPRTPREYVREAVRRELLCLYPTQDAQVFEIGSLTSKYRSGED